jgi:hypothetical protein
VAISAAAGVGIAHLPEMLLVASPLAAGVSTAARESERRSQVRRETESNEFYFLYEANRQLSR